MIQNLSKRIPVQFLCHHFSISRSSYYAWRQSLMLGSSEKKSKVLDAIKKAFKKSKGTYGSPRIYRELISEGILISENSVAKYMTEIGLDARLKRRFKVQTTDSNHNSPIVERLFKTEVPETFPTKPGRVFAGDITYIRLGSGFLYLAVVMDLYNREIVGWSMSRSLDSKIICDALKSATHKIGKDIKVVFHSDRGSQYASQIYRALLLDKEIIPSMSRKGNCYDNAFVESWFKSLKYEWIWRFKYSTEEELRALVFEYIETWYNSTRRHSSLGYKSPKEYVTNTEL